MIIKVLCDSEGVEEQINIRNKKKLKVRLMNTKLLSHRKIWRNSSLSTGKKNLKCNFFFKWKIKTLKA